MARLSARFDMNTMLTDLARDTVLRPRQLLARALDLPIGRLASGYAADFAAIDLRDLSMQPLSRSGQFLPNLVYSLQPTALKRVVVNGRVTVADGRLQLLEDEKLLERIRETMEYLES